MNDSLFTPTVEYPLLWLFDFVYPSVAKLTLNLDDIEIFEYDRNRLRKLQYERVLFIINHPTTMETPICYYVANCMGSRFNFIASRDVFEWFGGFVGELLRKIGAFSILSELDRDAIKTVRSILAKEGGKLAIYPEGMKSNENDNLLPLEPRAIQIGFLGLEDALKKDSKADITVVTCFVKYVLTEPKDKLLNHIESSLKAIEQKLQIHWDEKNLLKRFLYVGHKILENTEKEYNLKPSQESIEFRIARVRNTALNKAAENLGIQLDTSMDSISKMRELFSIVESYELRFLNPKYPNLKPKNLMQAKQDMEKAYTFLVIRPIYLISRPTAERMVEWLTRYETLLFGSSKFRPQKAVLQFAPFFGLKEYYNDYKKDKKTTIKIIKNRIQNYMESMLIEAIGFTSPIIEPLQPSLSLKIQNV